MNINTQYISAKNTNKGVNSKKYIVIHETDNFRNGANALAHAKAQYNGNLSTSVHFYCGSDGIYQTANLGSCCWAVGNTYKKMPITDATNNTTINIEICVNADGDYNVARQNAIELVKHLMAKLNLPVERVIRHYDAKGKYCPRKMMDTPSLWDDFKNSLGEEPKPTEFTPYLIKVDKVPQGDVLNIRQEPNANAKINGYLGWNDQNIYTIVGEQNGWGKLKSGVGWINLYYTKRVDGTVKQTKPTKTVDEWAREVLKGKHGNGHSTRKASLKASGCTYDYEIIRKRVNELS